MTYQGVRISGRSVLYSWSLLSLVLVATYTSKLTASSVLTQQPLPFTSLSDLVKRSDYRWTVTKGTMFDSVLSTSTDKDYQLYHQKTLEFAKDDPDIRLGDLKSNLVAILNRRLVWLTGFGTYNYLNMKDCRVTMAQERLFQDTQAIHLQKDSPYTDMFNRVISHTKETGILNHLERKWFPDNADCDLQQTTVVPVSLDMVRTAFVMAACGLLLAALLLGWECRCISGDSGM